MIKKEMLDKKLWAIVGATPNKDKYAYKILKKLLEHGYETYAINPNYNSIDGKKVYSNLKEVPKNIDVINLVVPPEISFDILGEAKGLGIEYIWFQPGTFDNKVIKKAEDLGFKILYNDCVLATLIELENK